MSSTIQSPNTPGKAEENVEVRPAPRLQFYTVKTTDHVAVNTDVHAAQNIAPNRQARMQRRCS